MIGVAGHRLPSTPPAVIVISLGHIGLAILADIVLLVLLAVVGGGSGRRSLLMALPPSFVKAWSALVINLKRAVAVGAAGLLLLFVFDPKVLASVVEGSIAVTFFGLFLVLLWGGIVGVALAVPALAVSLTYRRARRTMEDYRLGEDRPGGYDRSWSGPYSSPGDGQGDAGWGPSSPGSGRPVATLAPFAAEFDVLGLTGRESPSEVKRKWRELVAGLHPDLRGADSRTVRDSAQERLKYVNAAYTVLKKHGLAL